MNKAWSVDYITAQLNKVRCGGQIPQILVGKHLNTIAANESGLLVVSWDGVDEPLLPKKIGIGDLSLFIAALNQIDKKAYVYVDDNRLVVEGDNSRVSNRLIFNHPDHVTTKTDSEIMNKVDAALSEYEQQTIPGEVFESLKSMQRMVSSETLKLIVSPEGSTFVVGSGTENIGKVDVPELVSEDEYTLFLPAQVMRDIMGVFYMDCDVKVRLSGPQSIIELVQSSVRYVVSPVAEDE